MLGGGAQGAEGDVVEMGGYQEEDFVREEVEGGSRRWVVGGGGFSLVAA